MSSAARKDATNATRHHSLLRRHCTKHVQFNVCNYNIMTVWLELSRAVKLTQSRKFTKFCEVSIKLRLFDDRMNLTIKQLNCCCRSITTVNNNNI